MSNINILAIDCSLKKTGVAICDSQKFLAHEQKDLGRNQSFELPFMTERVLKNSGLSWNDINYVSVTKGPGYFTGIRVGASYATGIAFALGVKIIPVSSLSVLSRSFNFNDVVGASAIAGELIKPDLSGSFEDNKIPRLKSSGVCQEFLTLVYAGHGFVYASAKNLPEGEYSHDKIFSWLANHKEIKSIISDDSSKLNMNIDIKNVNPEIFSLCEIALENTHNAINPTDLKISYYRAPQGVF